MLKVISIDESMLWDKAVKGFDNYDVYYLSHYIKAFMLHGDGEPMLFYYNTDTARAINVVMKRDIAKDLKLAGRISMNTFYDITTPYGYGGFLIEGKKDKAIIKNILEEYNRYCIKNNIICEFVRFHPILNNQIGMEDFYDIVNIGKTISMHLGSIDNIWDVITSKNRNVIRKAKKSDVGIYWGRDPWLFNEFFDMYNITMDKDNADEYYYFKKDFYQSVLNDLKYNSLVFYAVYNKKTIAMSIILFANMKMHYHLSASLKEYLQFAPTNLLLYEAACWGSNNGYKTFHLGGGLGSKEDSLYKFKKAFNKNNHNDFFIGKKIFDKETYDELVEMRNKEKDFNKNSNYFPAYRI